jgi:sugar diacid utilization regulator
MSITFSEVISKLPEGKIVRLVDENVGTSYQQVRLLSPHSTDFCPETIYIGEASLVPASIHSRRDIGLILVNNCNFDFSLLEGNAAELPPGTDLFSLFNAVLDVLNSRRRVVDGSATVLNCLIQGKGLNAIIQLGAEIFGKPVSLVDYTGKQLVIAYPPGANLNDQIIQEGPTPETYSIFRTYNFTKKVNESPLPVLVDFEHGEMPPMIIGKITIKDKIVGHLAVIGNKQPFAENDLEIAKVLIDVVAAEVQKNDYYLLMAGVHHEYFILDLLQEKHDHPTTIEDRVRSLQWDAFSDFFVVAIHLPRKNEVFFFVEYIRARLGNLFPFSESIYYDENIILVLYRDRDIQQVARKLEKILVGNDLTAGISLRFSSIVDLKRHYEQAVHALSIGKILKRDGPIFFYDDLYLYDLLTILNRHANLKDFCHPGVDRLRKYDQANGTDYYRTLFEYLMSGADMVQVAKKLYIHRNTLYHRLKKIFEITEMDLDSGDDYLKLLLSIKIIELYSLITDPAG